MRPSVAWAAALEGDENEAEALKSEAELHGLLNAGLSVAGRQFAYLAHKIEHNSQDAKLMFVAVGKSVILQKGSASSSASSSADHHHHHWSSAGGSLLGGWETADECRALFADFEMLEVPKMCKRLQLLFSPTTRCLEMVRDGHARAHRILCHRICTMSPHATTRTLYPLPICRLALSTQRRYTDGLLSHLWCACVYAHV